VFAVDVGRRLHHGAGRTRDQILEFRAAVLVGLHGDDLRPDVKIDRMPREIVRQRSANQAHRHGAVGEIVHGPRDARHLFGVGHRDGRGGGEVLAGEGDLAGFALPEVDGGDAAKAGCWLGKGAE